MNAELGRRYDVDKMLAWCFSANTQHGVPRRGWGTIAERFGDYDCHGLQGSTTDSSGYAFAMNTFDAAGLITPLVRYDARYARAIGKWMLNLANASRLFYPDALPNRLQSSHGWKSDPANAVPYEGLRKRAVVAPDTRGEKTIHGRIVSGTAQGLLDAIGLNHSKVEPEVLLADDRGRLEHIWTLAIPTDAMEVPFWVQLRCRAPAESFALSGSYSVAGPWQPLARFPRRNEKPGPTISTTGAMHDPCGHDKLFVRLASQSGTPPEAQVTIQRWNWRVLLDRSPFATGDPVLNRWGAKTDLGVYGGSHVGYLAALVGRTNQERILQLDLLATDFFHDQAYPTYLYFNPEQDAREIMIDVGPLARDLYETTQHRFLKRTVQGAATFRLAGDSAAVIVVTPAEGKVEYDGKKMSIDGTVIDFDAKDEE
jgi:hypothetical protein